MKPDLIFANSPYGKPGVEITKYIMENFPNANYAMLNTRSAFKKYYDKLACAFVQIGQYELGSNNKLDWGVEQAILLATNGWTEVIDNRKRKDRQPFQEGVSVGTSYMDIRRAVHLRGRTSHLVGVSAFIDRAAWNHRTRNAHLVGIEHMAPSSKGFQAGRISHLVGMAQSPCTMYAQTHLRTATLVQLSLADTVGTAATHQRSTTLTQVDKSVDVKLRNGYIYVSFETFEEACECAIDIISWTDPTDSHYRCVKWGFVTGLVPHYKAEK